MCGLAQTAAAQDQPAQIDAPIPNNPYHAIYMLDGSHVHAPAASDEVTAEAAETPCNRLELDKPQLRYAEQPLYTFWQTPRVPNDVSIELGAEFQRSWKLTVSSIKEFIDFREAFGQKMASVPLFGSTDLLHVSSSSVWVNMLDTHQTSSVHFGPYLESWKSIRKDFNGHYGVQLRVAW